MTLTQEGGEKVESEILKTKDFYITRVKMSSLPYRTSFVCERQRHTSEFMLNFLEVKFYS